MTLRAKVLGVKAPADAIDIVGTGGDVKGTWNVSTCSAFVLAGCGVPVAKHGNRAVSSKTGAADVLTALGVNIDCDFRLIQMAIVEAGVGFLMAPAPHGSSAGTPAWQAGVRKGSLREPGVYSKIKKT